MGIEPDVPPPSPSWRMEVLLKTNRDITPHAQSGTGRFGEGSVQESCVTPPFPHTGNIRGWVGGGGGGH